jgi:hypothetical protein
MRLHWRNRIVNAGTGGALPRFRGRFGRNLMSDSSTQAIQSVHNETARITISPAHHGLASEATLHGCRPHQPRQSTKIQIMRSDQEHFVPSMDNKKRKPGGNSWYLLLLVPFVGTLWVPFYNSVEPTCAGIPFFYWYQMLMVFIGAGITAIVYFATE